MAVTSKGQIFNLYGKLAKSILQQQTGINVDSLVSEDEDQDELEKAAKPEPGAVATTPEQSELKAAEQESEQPVSAPKISSVDVTGENSTGDSGSSLGILSGLLGLGTSIATQLPLTQKTDAQKRLESGQGAASTLSRQATDAAAQNALAVASSGRGTTQGLRLRQGLQQSEAIRSRGQQQASLLAAQEQQQALGLEQQRRMNMARLGAASGSGLAAFGAQTGSTLDDSSKSAKSQARADMIMQLPKSERRKAIMEDTTLTPTQKLLLLRANGG